MQTIAHLGQSGFILNIKNIRILIDPYLSNYVEEIEGVHQKRLIPIPSLDVTPINYVFSTHAHLDHCDPITLKMLVQHSPHMIFIGPVPCINIIHQYVDQKVPCQVCSESWIHLTPDISYKAIPAAHPTISREPDGTLTYVGYIFNINGKLVYHAGDTSVDNVIIETINQLNTKIDLAILPVNEKNYFKDKAGIVGNMSVREAYSFAEAINAKKVFPMHWDMFKSNSVYPEEIKLAYQKGQYSFELIMHSEIIL